ncbi:N-acetylglucosamine kinase [uncultured Nitratireductor sp.]|uniref:N-acetylglucosamine kinase n=1 Tax=uncultured Nitratireductor sp. TaxID=520953 RepID=UPI0025CC9DF2|nr:N-acetylglucosamine kinase [uncultured Nitratireductor sp.]
MSEGHIHFYLGIDGGGTGCRARIEDTHGTVLGQGLSGPATTRLGVDGAWASVRRAFEAAIDEAGFNEKQIARIHAGVGLAGMRRKGAIAAFEALPHRFARIVFASDSDTACLGAHSGLDGAIAIAGTGSVGLGLVKGRRLRIGGYGFPISDEGSGADIGLNAVRAALQGHDGRIPLSLLLTEIMNRFDDDPAEVVAWMDRASATDYATLAPMVLRHADQGDAAARRIVQDAAAQIDMLVRTLFDQKAPRVTLLGGLSGPLEPWLSPDVRRRLKPADGDAVDGAIILARRAAEGLPSL